MRRKDKFKRRVQDMGVVGGGQQPDMDNLGTAPTASKWTQPLYFATLTSGDAESPMKEGCFSSDSRYTEFPWYHPACAHA